MKSLVLVPVALWALAGCSRPPFELTIQLRNSSIKAGEHPFVKLTLKNVSSETQEVLEQVFDYPGLLESHYNRKRELFLEAMGPNGKEAPPDPDADKICERVKVAPDRDGSGRSMSFFSVELKPEETVSTPFFAFKNGCSIKSPPDPSFDGFAELFYLSFDTPGTYRIRAVLDTRPPEGSDSSTKLHWQGRIESPEVTLEVRP